MAYTIPFLLNQPIGWVLAGGALIVTEILGRYGMIPIVLR